MLSRSHRSSTLIVASTSLILAGCGSKDAPRSNAGTPASSTTPAAASTANGALDTVAQPRHHSKAKGAVRGAAAGAVLGGKKGALVGAAVGAEAQHHRNKVEQQRAAGH
jgi:outer membrane lipoprotein SlyB